jgi:anaerobic selenocysteine-containing dehydrogenase
MMGSLSYPVGMALGTHEPCIVLNTRVAQAMHIQEGDEVEFEILEAAERFTGAVSVNPNINADVVIHGAGLLGIATAESVYVRLSDLPTELTTVYGGASVYGGDGSEFSLTLKSGTVLKLPLQEIRAGIRIHERLCRLVL